MSTSANEGTVWSWAATALSAYYSVHGIYLVEGVLMTFVNVVIVAAVCRQPMLRRRKEYIIVAALALADSCSGGGLATAGLYRGWLDYRKLDGSLEPGRMLTPWQCMSGTPHALLYLFGNGMAALMLLCVSFDRLLAVSVPLRYYQLGGGYARRLCAAFYAVGVSCAGGYALASYLHTAADGAKVVKDSCPFSHTIGTNMAQSLSRWMVFYPPMLSVLLYIAVPLVYRMQVSKSTASNQSAVVAKMRTQRRLIVTLGITSVCTLILYVLPSMLKLNGLNWILDAVTVGDISAWSLCNVMMNANTLTNVVAYWTRHRDLRDAIKRAVTCRRGVAGIQPAFTTAQGGAAGAKSAVVRSAWAH